MWMMSSELFNLKGSALGIRSFIVSIIHLQFWICLLRLLVTDNTQIVREPRRPYDFIFSTKPFSRWNWDPELHSSALATAIDQALLARIGGFSRMLLYLAAFIHPSPWTCPSFFSKIVIEEFSVGLYHWQRHCDSDRFRKQSCGFSAISLFTSAPFHLLWLVFSFEDGIFNFLSNRSLGPVLCTKRYSILIRVSIVLCQRENLSFSRISFFSFFLSNSTSDEFSVLGSSSGNGVSSLFRLSGKDRPTGDFFPFLPEFF